MSTLLSEIHFWTTQEDVLVKHTDYGVYKYYHKKENLDAWTYQSKRLYCLQRGITWNPVNKRQNKLKDKLKELEDNLIQNKIICYLWKDNILQLLLSTGLVVYINVNTETGDINSITYDKQFSTKLQVNIICDGTIIDKKIICICNDGHVLGHGGLWKEGWLLEGGPRRRLHCSGEWLVVWGKASSENPQPWSPLAKDHQRANLHLYWIGSRGAELLAYKNSEGEPLIFAVSEVVSRSLILVEQKDSQRGVVSVEVSALELVGSTLKTVSITSVPLQTQVSCCKLSHNENYLLIGCVDGTLALLDRPRGSTKTVKAAFIPTLSAWHKNDALLVVCNERGQFQYYDTALNCVSCQIVGEENIPSNIIDLAGYFNSQFSITSINWDSKDLVIALEQGPVILITHIPNSLSFCAVARKYLFLRKVDKAIALLLSWEFSEESMYVLQRIIAYLLRQPLTEDIASLLQEALGFYHGSSIPLSLEIKQQYGSQVFSLTRRFFHQLVRAEMYETAFLLAVDMGHHDLFMDLHYIAVKIGETEMAAAARAQASALVSRCSSDASSCSRSSCSQCSSESEDESHNIEGNKTKSKTHNTSKNNTSVINSFDQEHSKVKHSIDEELISTNFNEELLSTIIDAPQEMITSFNEGISSIEPSDDFLTTSFNDESPKSIITPNEAYVMNFGSKNMKFPLLENHLHSLRPPPSINTNADVLKYANMQKYVKTTYFDDNILNFQKNIPKPLLRNENAGENINQSFRDIINSNLVKENFTRLATNTQNDYAQSNRFNVIKPPQIPVRLTRPTGNINRSQINHFSSSIPNLLNSNLGIPLVSSFNSESVYTRQGIPSQKATLSHAKSASNIYSGGSPRLKAPIRNQFENRNSNIRQIVAPPLPIAQNITNFSIPDQSLNKKVQPKVKFSDTVTAFIVPEIKRPVRPPPPPHVTDPQKELADSLPLCHPNEDYLKDFTPVKKSDSKEGTSQSQPPKIKVVHFGVV